MSINLNNRKTIIAQGAIILRNDEFAFVDIDSLSFGILITANRGDGRSAGRQFNPDDGQGRPWVKLINHDYVDEISCVDQIQLGHYKGNVVWLDYHCRHHDGKLLINYQICRQNATNASLANDLINRPHYFDSLMLIWKDYNSLLDHVDGVAENEMAYSIRSYELLLRCCTEFESLCKEHLRLANDGNINKYRVGIRKMSLENHRVVFHRWRPRPREVVPFPYWSLPDSHPDSKLLPWYQEYNQVKHNRSSKFEKANLRNVMGALAGTFVLMSALDVIPASGPGHSWTMIDSHTCEISYAMPQGLSVLIPSRSVLKQPP